MSCCDLQREPNFKMWCDNCVQESERNYTLSSDLQMKGRENPTLITAWMFLMTPSMFGTHASPDGISEPKSNASNTSTSTPPARTRSAGDSKDPSETERLQTVCLYLPIFMLVCMGLKASAHTYIYRPCMLGQDTKSWGKTWWSAAFRGCHKIGNTDFPLEQRGRVFNSNPALLFEAQQMLIVEGVKMLNTNVYHFTTAGQNLTTINNISAVMLGFS